MEYFKSSLKSVLGAPQDANQQQSVVETIDRLVDRVQTSTLLDDRRDACRALKAFAVKHRFEIGTQAMDTLIHVLECDRTHNEIVGYALETICSVINGPRDDDNSDYLYCNGDDIGLQFTEIFIKKTENVSLLLELIEEYDFKIRWPIVRLLSGLLSNRPKDLQECILVCPMGVSRLMDLLSDTREIIRNDTLLLLELLTKSNANIQKIVAFENAFDKLLPIIAEEGYSDGGVIVGDCLRVILTLLKNNTSNQTFFKEGSYIKFLAPFFELQESSEQGWSQQKALNTLTMLEIIRVLVSPNNPQQVTSSAQKAMFQSGLLEQLSNVLMTSGVPADVLTETINAVAELIRGNHGNQEYFSSVCAPTTPPKPAIMILLMSMINDKQPFSLRCSVLYCIQCYLYRNELAQAQVVQTLLPSSAEVNTMSVGQLLCGGLFSTDYVSKWFAAVALSHALVDNTTQKEQLLRVQLATTIGKPAIPLISQCSLMLQQGGKLQTRLGLLMLMSTWLANCTVAVMEFLSIPTNIPFLTSQVNLTEGDEHEDIVQGICAFLLGICVEFNDNSQPSFTREDLCQLIVKRIGLQTFVDKLVVITKNENYSRAAQNPHPKFKQPSEILLDHEFCQLFKNLEGVVIKAIQPKSLLNGPESSMTPEQQELLRQYKDLIREQDQQLHVLRTEIGELKSQFEMAQQQVMEASSTIQQLKDQNYLLKAQRSVTGGNSSQEVQVLRQEIEDLKLELKNKSEVISTSAENSQNNNEHPVVLNTEHSVSIEEHSLTVQNHQKLLEEKNKELQDSFMRQDELTNSLKETHNMLEELREENKKLLEESSSCMQQLKEIQTEQDDTLVLLTEISEKYAKHKMRLRELGETVSEDEDDSQLLNCDPDLNDVNEIDENM